MPEDTQAPNDTQDAEVITKSPSGPIVVDPHFMPRDSKGHFLPGYRPTSSIVSSQQGRDMRARLTEAGQRSARQALADKAKENGLQRSPAAAVGLAAGTLFEAAMTCAPDGKVREAKEGFSYAIRLAGMQPADEKQAMVVVPVQINIGPELVRAYGDEESG